MDEQNNKIELPKLKNDNSKQNLQNSSDFVDNLTIQPPIINKKTNSYSELSNPNFIDNLTVQIPIIDQTVEDVFTKKEEIKKTKNKKINMFTTKNLVILSLFTLLFSIITINKTFSLRNKVDNYEELITEINYKESNEVKMYNTKEESVEPLKNSGASKIVSCLEAPIDISKLPENITSIISEINSYYNQSNNYFSFKYLDIFSGFTISYNENQNIFTASTIKAPVDIYVYELASKGEIDLNKELLYTNKYYSSGSGHLKNGAVNTYHTIKNLVEYSIEYSDNIAHHMLTEHFGRENILKFWQEKGTTAIFTNNSIWGVTNAHDAIIYMKELYDFYIANDEYGETLMKHFINNKAKLLRHPNKVAIASKSGWSGSAIHDASLIFDENPYIVIAMSNLGTTDYYKSYFNKVSDMTYRLHTAYWNYKMDVCYDS